jgi:hypothetical protein
MVLWGFLGLLKGCGLVLEVDHLGLGEGALIFELAGGGDDGFVDEDAVVGHDLLELLLGVVVELR